MGHLPERSGMERRSHSQHKDILACHGGGVSTKYGCRIMLGCRRRQRSAHRCLGRSTYLVKSSKGIVMVRLLCALFLQTALLVSAVPIPSYAQNWPQRTVKFIVPLGPGSGVDIGARLFAEKLSQRWGQPVVVENRPGGDSIVAITSFLSSDDHTLLFSPSAAFTAHPFLHEKVPYNSPISCRWPAFRTRWLL